MSLLAVAGANSAVAAGYDIDNSLKLESDNTEYLTYTPSSTTNVKTWTFSCWAKRTELYNGSNSQHLFGHFTDGSNHTAFRFDDADVLELRNVVTGTTYELKTDQVFRDTSAWYHIVIAFDTTQSTAADRTKVYVNGNQVTLSGTYTALNQITYINTSGDAMGVGTLAGFGNHFNGYMAEIHHIDGQQLAASDFGETDSDTGIWKPKEYTGTYGSNGFYLDFEDSGSLGADDSGNGNNFTLNNITSADQATDTPTNNFAIYNQLIPKDEFEIYLGATRSKKTTTNRWRTMASTLAVANGKWYAEFQNSLYSTTGTARFVGVAPASIFTETSAATGGYLGGSSTETTDSIGYHSDNGQRYINGSGAAYGDSWTTDEIIGVALDMDNGYVYFSKNGTWQNSGDPTSGSSGTGGIALQLSDEAHYIAGSIYNSNAQLEVNYGGFTFISVASGNSDANGYGNFEYAPPSGYYALCSKNLAEYG